MSIQKKIAGGVLMAMVAIGGAQYALNCGNGCGGDPRKVQVIIFCIPC